MQETCYIPPSDSSIEDICKYPTPFSFEIETEEEQKDNDAEKVPVFSLHSKKHLLRCYEGFLEPYKVIEGVNKSKFFSNYDNYLHKHIIFTINYEIIVIIIIQERTERDEMIQNIRDATTTQIEMEHIITNRQNSYYRGVLTDSKLKYADKWNVTDILRHIADSPHGCK